MSQQAKRNQIAKLAGIVGRITFVDNNTRYVRLERGDKWKAVCFEKDLEPVTDEETDAYHTEFSSNT